MGLDRGTRVTGVTSRGGLHLGHVLARGRGGASRVAGPVEDWQDTCLGCEGRIWSMLSMKVC